ncbi:hypothetical protein PR202_ga29804 [Eleusine coracana subsp. coracana]|uniref:AAA+ ATPase domain-containing protein n=1 Tax=Eleusine coracana subsp. coracana TaxID=191504 RepID=A0AAV5DMU1_ELECO|nr:hypothetical protein PR202_ga29804 [Eleusine coracana subsp. coracana]
MRRLCLARSRVKDPDASGGGQQLEHDPVHLWSLGASPLRRLQRRSSSSGPPWRPRPRGRRERGAGTAAPLESLELSFDAGARGHGAGPRGYLLYGPPGTGKSSLVAAIANHLLFNIYDLDLSEVRLNSALQRLLIAMPNKSILLIEDIDCCFDAAASRETAAVLEDPDYTSDSSDEGPAPTAAPSKGITLSGLLNFIDGLWSTCGEERIIVFTTNYKDRLDPALLRPGRMDMHVYMGYCCWEAFNTLAWNYFLIDDHLMFQEIQELLRQVEVTPAEVSEMLLRSEDVDVALRVLAEFLQEKK